MRAAVYQDKEAPLSIETVPDPAPAAGEVVVRVRACGVCGSDLHLAGFGLVPPGAVLGHEFTGEIAGLSPEAAAAGWQEGERVTALPYIGCGVCLECQRGRGFRCRRGALAIGLGRTTGGYAEFVRSGIHSLVRLPAGLDWRRAALSEPLAVALHAMQAAAIPPGGRVLVLGGGPIGLACALWARFLGAGRIGLSEPVEGRRALAARLGATDLIDTAAGPPGERFTDLAGGPPDVVVEAVGVPGLLAQAFQAAPVDGRVVVVGVCMQPDQILPAVPLRKELLVRFVLAYTQREFEFTVEAMAAGRIDPTPLITDVVPLDGLPAAFAALRAPSGQAKVLWESQS